MKTTGEILKEYREVNNLTVLELAEQLNISQVLLTYIENNKRNLSDNVFFQMEKIFPKDICKKIKEYEDYKNTPLSVKKKISELEKKIGDHIEFKEHTISNDELCKLDLFVKGHMIGNDDFVKNEDYKYEGKTLNDSVHKECYFIKLDSEKSLMPRGGVLLIDSHQKEIINLKVYFIKYEGKEYLKRIIKTKQDIIVLKSLNNGTDDIYTQIEDIEIKGRAVKFNYEEDL